VRAEDARGDRGCPLCDLLAAEARDGARVVVEAGGLVLLAAYAGRLPYELVCAPLEHPDGGAFASDVLAPALELVAEGVRRLHAVEGPVPLNAWLHDGRHWHVELVPRLTILAGLELGAGIYVNTLPPEDAAQRLREAPG
jgi:UDPglucose--hexose-1-phosphate uridylyltransferase